MTFVSDVWDEQLADTKVPLQVFADTSGQTGYTAGFRSRMPASPS